ncbi:MAG: YidE/YbjL duplication [Firmicutes bacterium]|nr:YidE/YbjL duplication [Bacillota bacterium]
MGGTLEIIFLLAACGYLLGGIRVKGINLGTSGVLLAALYFGHLGYEIPPLIRDLGLALFVGAVGLIAGPRFFRNLKKNAMSYGAIAIAIVASSAFAVAVFSKIFAMPGALSAGIYTGALTTTPGLAAALEVAKNNAVSIGYGIAYPFGVVGVVLFVQALPRLLGRDLREEMLALTESAGPLSQTDLMIRDFIVKQAAVYRKTLSELNVAAVTGAIISRIKKGNQVFPAFRDTVLLEGDVIRAVGTDDALKRLEEMVGPCTSVRMNQPGLEMRNLVLESSTLVGKTLQDLSLNEQYGIMLTRIKRAGIEFVPTAQTVFEHKDIIHAVGPTFGLDKLQTLTGKQRKAFDELGMLPFMAVLAIGTVLGRIRFMIPGTHGINLGLSGGPLIAGLIVGHFGGIGSLLLRPSSRLLNVMREAGLMLFLAGAGMAAGHGFVETVAEYGWLLFLGGAVVTLIPMCIGFILAISIFKLSLPDALGSICGGMTSTPALGALITAAGSEDVAASYAAIYPFALVLVVIASQTLASIL